MLTPDFIPEPTDADTRPLLEYLQTHDALCPLCKYNLRHLTQPRCPECGRALKLTVGLTEPHLKLLVVTLVGACIAGGCGVPALVVVFDQWRMQGRFPRFPTSGVDFIIYGSVASIIPATLCVLLHKRFLRAPPEVQFGCAVAAWIWDALLFSILLFRVFAR